MILDSLTHYKSYTMQGLGETVSVVRMLKGGKST